MTTGSRVQSLPRTCRCVAFEKSAYLRREPPTPPPSLILSSEYTSLLLIRAYTNFRPHTTFVSKQSICRLLFFVSVEGASFHGDNMVQCVTTAVVMRRGHSILFQERGDTFITAASLLASWTQVCRKVMKRREPQERESINRCKNVSIDYITVTALKTCKGPC